MAYGICQSSHQDLAKASAISDLFNQSHEQMKFIDREGGSAGDLIKSLAAAVSDGKELIRTLRAVFIELVLVLALGLKTSTDEKENQDALKMIRDQFTALAGNKDGVTEADIHQVLYREADRTLK